MKTVKTIFIVCILLVSMIITVIPSVEAENQDSYGYTCKDSNTFGGPTYEWIEIADESTNILPNQGYFSTDDIEIGFSFGFYGQNYSQISVVKNGYLSFNPIIWPQDMVDNALIRDSPVIDGFIAPLWDPLAFNYDWNNNSIDVDSGVFCKTIGNAPNRALVIQWNNLGYSEFLNQSIVEEGDVTFEAILYEGSNNIKFQYNSTWYGVVTSALNGGSATVGIEDQSGTNGISYSFNEPVLSAGLAIEFYFPEIVSEANLYVSINGPLHTTSLNTGETVTYTISYSNLGGTPVNEALLVVNMSLAEGVVNYLSSSNGGVYDPFSKQVIWEIGLIEAYPLGYGSRTVTLELPTTTEDTEFTIFTWVASEAPETDYSDNQASILTQVAGLNIPETVNIESNELNADIAGTPILQADETTTFTYNDPLAVAVDICINLNDGQPDITGQMIGPEPEWTYTLTFGSRSGVATVEFFATYLVDEVEVTELTATANIEVIRIDPAGYIYDVATGERIAGATVWLQMYNERGGWINVPTDVPDEIAIASPNVNPQVTSNDGRYKWDTVTGTYRVHVEANGYYSIDSYAVTVPPPVTDLNVGLTKIPQPQDNAPPNVNEINAPTSPVAVNTPIAFASVFTDENKLDKHSAVWNWGDDSSSKGTLSETTGTIVGTHAYASSGVYLVSLTVTDNNGGSDQVTTQQYIVIYDLNAGFVTGGGWINSPQGAYTAGPTLTGKATFGFVSKYNKGANTPTGNTEFDFRIAKLSFHSTSYEWLLIAGPKAMYKGSGTINGNGDFSFILTAIDGELKTEGSPDTFRIKIWDKTTGNIIYDNQIDTPDKADPTTIIAAGNIILHKK